LSYLEDGKIVVRLKNGDPFVFGRGGEEIIFFRKHGFEAKIIPGVSSSFAAASSSNIPLTHRGIADQFMVCTGHGKDDSFPEMPPFSPMRTTVILMGVGRIDSIMRELKNKGYPSNWPVAVIMKATFPDQRTVHGSVDTIGEIVKEEKIKSPATIIIGNVTQALIPQE